MLPDFGKYPVSLQNMLHELISNGEILELTTCYKGLSLTRKISHLIIEDDCLHFKPPHDISNIKLGQVFQITQKKLPVPIAATISGIDLISGIITASDVRPIDHHWEIRKNDRVQPNHPMRAIMSVSQRSISTCVVDISENGLGLLLYHMKEKGFEIKLDTLLQLGIRLPNNAIPLLLHGSISRIHQIGKTSMASLGIRLMPTEKQGRYLRRYVNLRQAEILDELTNLVHISMEPVQTKDLYF
jgi:hypothetical protein